MSYINDWTSYTKPSKARDILEQCMAMPNAIHVNVERETLMKIISKYLAMEARLGLGEQVMQKSENNNIIVQIDVISGLGTEPEKLEPTIIMDGGLLGWKIDKTIVSQLSDVFSGGRKLILPFSKTS